MAKTTELELAIKIAGKVDPSLQAAISAAQKQASTLSATLGTVGRVGLAVMGAGLVATVKGIADCTKEAEKFESQMAPVIRYVDGLADSLGKAENSGCRPCSQGRGESGVAASQRGGAGRGKAGCWREGRSIFRCGGYWGKRRG